LAEREKLVADQSEMIQALQRELMALRQRASEENASKTI
jgi:hypothetical protein